MKTLEAITPHYAECARHLAEFRELLAAHAELSERNHVLPFFQSRPQLGTLFEVFNSRIGVADRYATEFDIFGDFRCDLAVGNWRQGAYCFVEFEDARPGSVFERRGEKATRDWGRRFEKGYSQVVDWVYKMSGRETSVDNLARFGTHDIQYEAVLVIGRDHHLDAAERRRLAWRSDRVLVDHKKVSCLTFDQLLTRFEIRIGAFGYLGDAADESASGLND